MLEQSAACRIQISFTGRQPLMLISTPIDGLSGRRLRAFFTGLSDEGLENTAALIMIMRIPHWLPVLSSDTLDGPLRERGMLWCRLSSFNRASLDAVNLPVIGSGPVSLDPPPRYGARCRLSVTIVQQEYQPMCG
jgi:hypothetical protein